MTSPKPFLKWVGGKTQILDTVLSKFPAQMHDYHEPFLGGGSVLLGFLSRVQEGTIQMTGTVYASDKNRSLIALYQNIQKNAWILLRELQTLVEESRTATGSSINRSPATLVEALTSPESYYYWIRSRFNALSPGGKTTPRGSAMFLFLNKTCFRGVYREGPHGFNVPYGHYKEPAIYDKDHLLELSTLLHPVVFQCCSFEQVLPNVKGGDFIYLDPPYAPQSETSFVGYTADGFSAESHSTLFRLCHGLTRAKIPFLLSNAEVPSVQKEFQTGTYRMDVLSCRRAIHSKNPETRTNEVLVSPRI